MEVNAEAREQFVQKLEKTSELFRLLFEKDPSGMIIGFEEREQLKTLQRRNEAVLKKLKSKEFSVAVVGLEKAGKSTLGNALISSIVLPEYTERCTYTTTEIRAGDEDEAKIFFYSREEFNDNFKKLLNAIGYKVAADFESLTLETFNRYWSAVENDESNRGLYELHNGTTVEDIRTILENKNDLRPLLSHAPMEFKGQDEWSGEAFQIFITGFKGKRADGSVIRGAQPYAVKKVIIHSTTLGEMDSTVLYDVPGFNSPTELHKKQTEDMLAAADAIILVTNVGTNPNLVGTQLDMLRKVRDEDGIRLNEKSFVFGNQLDRSGTRERAEGNKAALINDAVNKHQVATQPRVVVGSAKAYLERNGLFSKDDRERGLTGADKILDEWQMDYGIDILHDKMKEYYDTDRFAVLKARAERTLADISKYLRDLLDKYTPEKLEQINYGMKVVLNLNNRVDDFVKEANILSRRYQNEIFRERPFSKSLVGEIETIYPHSDEFEQLIIDVENECVIDTDGNYPLSNVNMKLREALYLRFLRNLVETAASITGDKQKEIRQALVELFLRTLGMDSNSPFRAELEQSANDLFDEFLRKSKGSDCIFNSLVERFAVSPLETLITAPFAEQQRLTKVRLSLPELFSLAVYYSMRTDSSEENAPKVEDNPVERMKLFAKILAHEGLDTAAAGVDANEEPLRNIFVENREAVCGGLNIDVNALPCDRWAKMLTNGGVVLKDLPTRSLNDFVNRIEDVIYKSSWRDANLQQRIERLDQAFVKYIGARPRQTGSDLGTQLDELYEKSRKLRAVTCKEEMISTLDADIEILRDVTVNAVVKAIGLERAFISVVIKNINLIRDGLSKSREGREIFNDWIERNVRKIKDSEFAHIDQENMNIQQRKMIVASIRQVADSMEV